MPHSAGGWSVRQSLVINLKTALGDKLFWQSWTRSRFFSHRKFYSVVVKTRLQLFKLCEIFYWHLVNWKDAIKIRKCKVWTRKQGRIMRRVRDHLWRPRFGKEREMKSIFLWFSRSGLVLSSFVRTYSIHWFEQHCRECQIFFPENEYLTTKRDEQWPSRFICNWLEATLSHKKVGNDLDRHCFIGHYYSMAMVKSIKTFT